MPKILKNLRSRLMEEARAQIEQKGYAGTTIRSVAAACGVAAGTVYNYFPSKEVLISSYLKEDWIGCLASIRADAAGGAEACLRAIHRELMSFSRKFRGLLADEDVVRILASEFWPRHLHQREQIAALLEPFFPSEDGFTARFIASSLITWSIAEVPFDRIYSEVKKLLPAG